MPSLAGTPGMQGKKQNAISRLERDARRPRYKAAALSIGRRERILSHWEIPEFTYIPDFILSRRGGFHALDTG